MNLFTIENMMELMERIKSLIEGHIGDIADEYPADQAVIDEIDNWLVEAENEILMQENIAIYLH